MEKPPSGLGLFIPGILFIALGVLIVVEPLVLVWVMAIGFVLLGVMMLGMGAFVRKIGRSFQNA